MYKILLIGCFIVMPHTTMLTAYAKSKKPNVTKSTKTKANQQGPCGLFSKTLLKSSILERDPRYRLLLLDWEKTN